MRKLIHKMFFKRNTRQGVDRYLSKEGFDIENYHIENGPNKNFVYAVSDEPESVEQKTELSDILGVPDYVMELLTDAGYTVEKIIGATDAELMKIDGIAKGRVRAIRKALGSI